MRCFLPCSYYILEQQSQSGNMYFIFLDNKISQIVDLKSNEQKSAGYIFSKNIFLYLLVMCSYAIDDTLLQSNNQIILEY